MMIREDCLEVRRLIVGSLDLGGDDFVDVVFEVFNREVFDISTDGVVELGE
jgi:hypothetical protein